MPIPPPDEARGPTGRVRAGLALLALVLGLLVGPAGATAGAAQQPQATAAPAGTVDGRSRLTVDMPGDVKPGSVVTVTVGGAPQTAQIVPLLSDRTATVVVVDASAAGAAQLQPGLSGVASLVLTAPPAARSALVADTEPPAVVAPLAVGSSDTLRGLTTVRPGGARHTAAALDLALRQLPPGPDDPRLVVLYTAAPDAGGPSVADLAGRLTAAGAVLAVVVPSPDVPTYWVAAAAATGGTAVAARSGVIAAFDALTAALRTRCLVTFPLPEVLPVAAVVHADTPQGPVTVDAVVSPPVAAATAAQPRAAGPAGVVGLVLLVVIAMLVWGALRSARRRSKTVPGDPDGGAWNVPAHDEHTAPRDRLMAALHAAVRDRRPAVLQSTHDAVGPGTTTAMIEFAYRWRGDHDIAWWVSAADPPLVADRLAELAEILGLAAPTDTAEEATDRLLAALRRRGRWLLVFDDAGSPRQLARFLPGGSGHVLVASDDPEWETHGTPIPVGPFDRDESVAVLRSRRPGLTAAEADRVAAALDDMPQAIDVAGATLGASGMSVETYLRLLTEREPAAASAAAAACAVALDRLAADDPEAWDVVATLAWLGSEPVPLSLLNGSSTGDDPARAADLAAVVHQRGLARVDGETVQLHPTAAGVIVRRSENGGGRATATVRLVRAAAPADPDAPEWRRLLPHVLAVTDPARRLDDVVLDVGWLLNSAGLYLRARGESRAARALFEDVHELYRRRLGPDHPDTITAARTLADDLDALGRQEHARQAAGIGGPRDPEAD